MFENTQSTKSKAVQPHFLRPFCPLSTNTPLRGQIKQIGKYEFSFDQKLGSGLTSDTYIGVQRQTLQPVCVKIIDRETFKSENQKQMLKNEIKCQQKLQSEYIVNIYDVYDTNSFCFVVTELCQDGDLFKLIQYSRFGLHEKLVIRLGYNLALALLKMKQEGIVHRDIKSENIMLKTGIAKLGDFGFAIQEKQLKEKEYFSIGSPLYMPLEALQDYKYSYESDIFSFGVVLYEMLHCQSPWQCSDQKLLIEKMKTQKVSFKTGVSLQVQEIITSCLEQKPEDRAKIEDIVKKLEQLVKSIDQAYEKQMQQQKLQQKEFANETPSVGEDSACRAEEDISSRQPEDSYLRKQSKQTVDA